MSLSNLEYFKNTPIFNFKGLIAEDRPLYAHLRESEEKRVYEPLSDHLDLTLKYLHKLCDEKNLYSVFEKFEKSFFKNEDQNQILLWREMFLNTVYMHDVGKMNPNFQHDKMKNKAFKRTESNNSNHSVFSAMIYFDYYYKKLNALIEVIDFDLFFLFLLLNTFTIQKHHGALEGFEDFLERLDERLQNEGEEIKAYKSFESPEWEISLKTIFEFTIEEFKTRAPWKSVDFYIYLRFAFSLLVACDFYATSDYMNNAPVKNFGTIENVTPYLDAFNAGPVIQSIRKTKRVQDPKGNINVLRSQMFLEAEENLLNCSEDSVVFLEAPTGSGKTITSINLALKFLEKDKKLNRIHYVFPFNTLVEQTWNSLKDCIGQDLSKDIGIINSITPIKTYLKESEDGEWDYKGQDKTDYEKSLLSRQFQHYPIVLTTHVHFFESLFGTSRENTFPLPHLANSVIILDEIQSYKNRIWKEIIIFLKAYARLLNFKVIVMSATLPDINQLSVDKTPVPELIIDKLRYYGNPLFKNRVQVDFSMFSLQKNIVFETLLKKVLETSEKLKKRKDINNKIVVEFIKKASAIEFFNRLNQATEDTKISIELMTGDDHKAERKRIINQVKTSENIILVATQVIEAGVDIDMDAGFKDISILDSEEQFLGRVNRSCLKKDAIVYFFNLDDAEVIYRGDVRKNDGLTLDNPKIQEILANKDFSRFYEKVLQALESESKKENDLNIVGFRDKRLWSFNMAAIKKRMQLIDDNRQSVSIFLNTTIQTESGQCLCGSDVFRAYEELLMDAAMPYAQKRIWLSKIQADMDYFIYEIDKRFADECALSPNALLGSLYYFEDGTRYFENGKFNRDKMKNESLFE